MGADPAIYVVDTDNIKEITVKQSDKFVDKQHNILC